MAYDQQTIAEIQRVLCGFEGVEDCAVVERRGEADGTRNAGLVAYVVPSAARDCDRIRQQVRSHLNRHSALDVVGVSAIPLTGTGEIDAEFLASLPVLDRDVIARCEQELAVDGFTSVRIAENVPPAPRLHLSDLVPPRAHTPAAAPRPADDHRLAERLAISTGEPLGPLPARNLQEVLATAAGSPGERLICRRRNGAEIRLSYAELQRRARIVAWSLQRAGIRPLREIVLQCEENDDLLTAFWGCILAGAVPVPLATAETYAESTTAADKLRNVCNVLNGPPVIAGALIRDEITAWAAHQGLEACHVFGLDALMNGMNSGSVYDSRPEDPGIILFTSGSTGTPKGVVQPHRNLIARSAAAARMNAFSAGDVTVNWFALDHVGGIVMFHLQDLFVGATQVHAPTEMILRDPLLWLELITSYRATRTWAPNFAFALINSRGQELSNRSFDLSSMEFILNGGEAIVARTARRFLELLAPFGLRRSVMRPAWGMSETCSGATFARTLVPDSDAAPFVEVGAPIPGVSIRLVSFDGKVVHEGETGRLQISGPVVTPGYYRNPELNAEAFTPDGWFETGDLAEMRDGRMTITGRSKDVIIINGLNFYSHEIEAAVDEIDGVDVSFTAACAVRRAGSDTDQLCIFFHPLSPEPRLLAELIQRIRATVLRRAGATPEFIVPVEREQIPKTAIGKIQRSQLRARFESGEFDSVIKALELTTAAGNTIPAWFYRRTWIPATLDVSGSLPSGAWLVFADQSGLAECFAKELAARSITCTVVRSGADFRKTSPNEFLMDLASAEDYARLANELQAADLWPANILHCRAYDPGGRPPTDIEALRTSQHTGCYSLLHLSQALAAVNPRLSARLFAISSDVQVTGSETRARTEHATIDGLLRSIALELPFRCSHIDFDDDDAEKNARRLIAEVSADTGGREVAYRGARRLVPCLERRDMSAEVRGPITLAENGFYLLAGGLGGIGTEVSRLLLQKFQAKLLIIGQNPLSDARLRRFEALKTISPEIRYAAVDLADADTVEAAVASAEEHFGRPLDGIFQLATEGKIDNHWSADGEHSVARESIGAFERMFAAKVYGTWSLSRLLEQRAGAVFVGFSSVNSIFSSATLSAYSAAGSYMDALFAALQTQSRRRAFCLNWTMWDDIGMSADAPEFVRDGSRRMGFHILSPAEGIFCLLACLSRSPGQYIIGLDGSNHFIARHCRREPYPLERIVAGWSGSGPVPPERALSLWDKFGTRIACACVTDDGGTECDTTGRETPVAISARAALTSPTERKLAEIWRELLGVAHLHAEEGFFDVGGDSLLVMRLLNRIEAAFALRLSLRALFENPTIRRLGDLIDSQMDEAQERDLAVLAEQHPVELLAKMNELSNEEVDMLLAKLAAGGA